MNFNEVSAHISLLGSISEIRKSDFRNYVVLNTGTVSHDAFCPRKNGHKPKYYLVPITYCSDSLDHKLQNVYYSSSTLVITFLAILIYFPEIKDVSAMFFDDVLVWIVVKTMSKKHRAQLHWVRFKTQRRHILEALTI